MRCFILLSCLLWIFCSCSTKALLYKSLKQTEKEAQDHVGFVLYDPSSKKTIVDYHGAHYFTPASNTKIFTFYTSLRILSDSAIALRYIQRNDSLIFWGAGDPSFLYSAVYANNRTLSFLKESRNRLFYSEANFQAENFGPGWAWDDYPYYYSAERSSMPIYGNLISIDKQASGFQIQPKLFAEHFIITDKTQPQESVVRDIDSNELFYYPGSGKSNKSSWSIPFRSSSDLLIDLLSDTLKRQVNETYLPLPHEAKLVKSIPLDSLYKVMMHESDNFIAEQLLLQCAGVLSDTLNPDIAIRYASKNLLNDLPDKPQWVDGSGLSRYNLFTPRSIVRLWEKISEQVPKERLFPLLATGGKYGTLKNWYKSEKPYVFGKTGSLSNNSSLSGYVMTKKGRILIFSFMNNNFVKPSGEVRKSMERILTTIHENY